MTKDELMQLTIKQLSESLTNSSECFELHEDPTWPYTDPHKPNITILWKFRVVLNGDNIPDPNNSPRTIILNYSIPYKRLSCHIFFRDVEKVTQAIMADATVEVHCKWPFFNKTYRSFSRLRARVLQKIKEKEHLDYLKKLNSIFPTILDENLFD